jgi:hypothetical protein
MCQSPRMMFSLHGPVFTMMGSTGAASARIHFAWIASLSIWPLLETAPIAVDLKAEQVIEVDFGALHPAGAKNSEHATIKLNGVVVAGGQVSGDAIAQTRTANGTTPTALPAGR